MRGLSGLRMHIICHPSIKECMCVWVPLKTISDSIHMPLTSSLSSPRACIPALMIYASIIVPAPKTLLDNYLLSLTRREYNQVIAFTQNIPHAMKMLIDIAEKKGIFLSPGIDFLGQLEKWTPVGPLFWLTLSICAKLNASRHSVKVKIL